MKNKKTFWVFSVTALLITIIFIALKFYSIAAVIIIGAIIAGHREIWSLIRYRKMPPHDERVNDNINKSIRNGFLAFIIISLITLLFYVTEEFARIDLEYYLVALILLVELVYVISYLFYDKIEANLGKRDIKALKILAVFEVASLVFFILTIFFPSWVFLFSGITDDVLMLRFLDLFPIGVFVLAIIGSSAIFVKGLFVRAS
ncbi:MAG: hypothetical protein WC877_07060 [Dehalococcoidales bacterium]|jgi:hypothetical protein|nr:hypothetical protein [Dehalococcoidales bacterium]